MSPQVWTSQTTLHCFETGLGGQKQLHDSQAGQWQLGFSMVYVLNGQSQSHFCVGGGAPGNE